MQKGYTLGRNVIDWRKVGIGVQKLKEKGRFGRVGRWVAFVAGCLVACLAGLWVWTKASEGAAHCMPQIAKISIEEILMKQNWDAGDYQVLEEQTGLSREALSYMEEQGRQNELAALQESYFATVEVDCVPNSIISKTEYVVDEQGMPASAIRIPYVEEGDILITCCSHVFGWRNGHAAMVVDADRRLVLEAQVLGSPSVITSLNVWEEYPSFLVLRLQGADREERAAIAEYAVNYLTGVPYHVTAGVWERLLPGGTVGGQQESCGSLTPGEGGNIPGGTHCSHLVWYAYYQFGYDLDSDGGIIVTPRDIAGSEKLMIIQKYGVG